jgi:predicted nuclease of predicted toxin-antitoxin system
LKLLFDNNLSVRIAEAMQEYFPGSKHVYDLNIAHFSDNEIWEYARNNDFAIVTKDKDFYHLALTKGYPPKVIWVVSGNCRNEEMIKILLNGKPDILNFLKNKKDILIVR